jgi:hypothetical protein
MSSNFQRNLYRNMTLSLRKKSLTASQQGDRPTQAEQGGYVIIAFGQRL